MRNLWILVITVFVAVVLAVIVFVVFDRKYYVSSFLFSDQGLLFTAYYDDVGQFIVNSITLLGDSGATPLDDQSPLTLFVDGKPYPVHEITPEFAMSLGATEKHPRDPKDLGGGVDYAMAPGPTSVPYVFGFTFIGDEITQFRYGIELKQGRKSMKRDFAFSVNGPNGEQFSLPMAYEKLEQLLGSPSKTWKHRPFP